MNYGIYEGTLCEIEYAHGRDEGRAVGERTAALGLGLTSELEAGAHEYMTTAFLRGGRAFWLGWLRGFREETR